MNIEENFEATLWRHRWCHHNGKYFWHNLGWFFFHIWGQIEAVFNISKFSKLPPFWTRYKLCYRKWYGELNIPERLPLAFPTFWAFDGRSSKRRYINFKIWPTLRPGDVTNGVMNTHLYKCSHSFMIPLHRKFNNDIFAYFLVIMKNVVI